MSRPSEVVPAGVPGRNKSERVQAMFGRIVSRYDLMNRLMTFGLDGGWRRATVRAGRVIGKRVLDLGCGTGDLTLAALDAGASEVIGTDFVGEMLGAARLKCPITEPAEFVQGDALHLPYPDASFDAVLNAFLLRNVGDLPGALQEMVRVLRPGGWLACLEITHPPAIVAPLFRLYFEQVVPFLGAAITGEANAYRYLPRSLGPLPGPNQLAQFLTDAGLQEVSYRRLGLGTVALHRGRRPTSA